MTTISVDRETNVAGDGDHPPNSSPAVLSWLPKVGLWAASFVACVVASIIVVTALAAVNEIVLPMTFAAVLAVILKPLVGVLTRHRLEPSTRLPTKRRSPWGSTRRRWTRSERRRSRRHQRSKGVS